MIVVFHKNFRKGLSKLTPNQKKRADKTLELFEQNPYDSALDNHALHGKAQDKRSISAGGDIRLIFKEKNNYEIVIFVRIGTHSQLY